MFCFLFMQYMSKSHDNRMLFQSWYEDKIINFFLQFSVVLHQLRSREILYNLAAAF